MRLARAFLLLLAAGLLGVGAHFHLGAVAARSWQETTGVVLSNHVRVYGAGSSASAGDTDTYVPVVRYEYRVGSKTLVGSRVGLADFPLGSFSSAMRHSSGFRKGSEVPVYYDPQEPSISVLNRGYPSTMIAMLLAAAAIFSALAVFLPRLRDILGDIFTSRGTLNG